MSGDCVHSPHLRFHAKDFLLRPFAASCAIDLAQSR